METRQSISKQVIKIAFFSVWLILLSGIVGASSAAFSRPTNKPADIDKIAPEVRQAVSSLQADEMTTVIVRLKAQANLLAITDRNRQIRIEKVINALQGMANATQNRIKALLQSRTTEGKVDQFESYWIFNGLVVTATADVIAELAALPEVDTITPNTSIQGLASQTAESPPEPNIALIEADGMWSLGFQGQGIVVANMDTGVDVTHPDLSAQWRGGSNSWFDPNGEHPDTPIDFNGHGTWTMGAMVGRDAGGTAIGVAPAAQWIAVKIFNDSGSATAAGIHAGFQWLLDPDGDPATPDTPNVVNNSWTFQSPTCNLEFQPDLVALRAVGIVPVFAAGNFGPNAGTSTSPANYPEAFAVGGTDNNDSIYTYSSRGPSACGEANTIYPEIVVPGVNIHTTDLYSLYTYATGTSLAAPQAAGGLALLLSSDPNLTVTEQESALLNSAVDLGDLGPDNNFGTGRLDILAAYQWLTSTTEQPTPTPTSTPGTGPNLALNKPVTVSSAQDTSHDGTMAVDGDLATLWQTAKAVGKNKLPAESITVDLEGSTSVSQVVLEWEANYATSYTIEGSNDNNTWVTMFSTTTGDGGNDTVTFSPVSARYVRLNSTAWSSPSQRNWLKEFEIYAGSGSPAPTPPPTNTPTFTPTATPTATPDNGTTMHVGDLDGSSSPGKMNRWDVTVVVTIHNANEAPLASATVNGSWSSGASGSASCVTNSMGQCSFTKTSIRNNVANVIFTVNSVTHSTSSYLVTANHDPDGDSDGTTISVLKP